MEPCAPWDTRLGLGWFYGKRDLTDVPGAAYRWAQFIKSKSSEPGPSTWTSEQSIFSGWWQRGSHREPGVQRGLPAIAGLEVEG